jgi:hypothetical protein
MLLLSKLHVPKAKAMKIYKVIQRIFFEFLIDTVDIFRDELL